MMFQIDGAAASLISNDAIKLAWWQQKNEWCINNNTFLFKNKRVIQEVIRLLT